MSVMPVEAEWPLQGMRWCLEFRRAGARDTETPFCPQAALSKRPSCGDVAVSCASPSSGGPAKRC